MLPLFTALESRSLGAHRADLNSRTESLRYDGFLPRIKYNDSLNCAPVTDLISTDTLVICVNAIGICSVYSKNLDQPIGVLNHHYEQVRSMFLNQCNSNLIIVTIKASEGFSQLRCRSFPLSEIESRRNQSTELFITEELKVPGFVEFDDCNKKVMTRCARTKVFKLWSLYDYTLLFSIADFVIQEVRLTCSLLLLIYPPMDSILPMKLVSAEDGKFLNAYELPTKQGTAIELVELFGMHLIFKQKESPLLIYNLLHRTYILVPNFASPCGFIYLHLHSAFVAVRATHFEVWNFQGKLLAKVESAPSVKLGFNIANKLFVTQRQDFIIICSRTQREGSCIIQVVKLATGKVVAEIRDMPELLNLSTIYFDEVDHELLTGDFFGCVTRWTS
mmetsp:Transcript_12964/g.24078  ORF Transcript_12964/g.24078 Transcript_12964/m.24078 type:complete len:390 (+) Transcript_12964:194-1363(+)